MSQKILTKRGLKANIPILDVGEPAFTTDTNEFFIGGASGNINITKRELEVVSSLPVSDISSDKIYILSTQNYSMNYYDGSAWHTLGSNQIVIGTSNSDTRVS